MRGQTMRGNKICKRSEVRPVTSNDRDKAIPVIPKFEHCMNERLRLFLRTDSRRIENHRNFIVQVERPSSTVSADRIRAPLLRVNVDMHHPHSLRPDSALGHPVLQMIRSNDMKVEHFVEVERHPRISAVFPKWLLDMAKVQKDRSRTVSAQVGQQQV